MADESPIVPPGAVPLDPTRGLATGPTGARLPDLHSCPPTVNNTSSPATSTPLEHFCDFGAVIQLFAIKYFYLLTYLLTYSFRCFWVALCEDLNWVYSVTRETKMWGNAQRDGRPAECRWSPLFNAAKFGWRPALKCRAVTLPRRETRWNLQGCPKLANTYQPIVGRSSPYHENMWRRYRRLPSFFRLSIHALTAKIQPDKVVRWCQNGDFLRPVFAASCVQHISDMHSKFALRPHHVSKYCRHPVEIRRGKKKKDRNHRTSNLWQLRLGEKKR